MISNFFNNLPQYESGASISTSVLPSGSTAEVDYEVTEEEEEEIVEEENGE
jgi:hypothetical protein